MSKNPGRQAAAKRDEANNSARWHRAQAGRTGNAAAARAHDQQADKAAARAVQAQRMVDKSQGNR